MNKRITFQEFLRKQIDLSALGVIQDSEPMAYFCTPKGAKIFGRAGVDGIHYCLIDGFDEMVFTVSPMNTMGTQVHPVAESFEDFLRLLLSCGDEAAIEQAWQWDRHQFEAFLTEYPPNEEQKAALAELADKTGLQGMDEPWQYIKSVQSSFDETRIEYTEDYYDPDMNPEAEIIPPQWAVYFESGFWGYHGRGKAGTEIPVRQEFEFAERKWIIPAIYSCGKGLVVDFCMEVPAGDIQAFMEKYDLNGNESSCHFTREEQIKLETENPLNCDFRVKATLNGKELRATHGYGITYNPCLPEGQTVELEAKWVTDHYALDPSHGWSIRRCCFQWATKSRPIIKTLSFTLQPRPITVPGTHFRVNSAGDSFSFTHPETGVTHTLTVAEYEQQTMDFSQMQKQDEEYPSHCTMMKYYISPTLPREAVTVSDCVGSDQPRQKRSDPSLNRYLPKAAVSIGIIGGADGPTELIIGQRTTSKEELSTVYSSLHFEPVEAVEWRITFKVERFQEKTVAVMS